MALVAGETLRGSDDDGLAVLDVPTAVMASDSPNRVHAEGTVERLVELMPRAARMTTGFPESPRPSFELVRQSVLAALIPYLR